MPLGRRQTIVDSQAFRGLAKYSKRVRVRIAFPSSEYNIKYQPQWKSSMAIPSFENHHNNPAAYVTLTYNVTLTCLTSCQARSLALSCVHSLLLSRAKPKPSRDCDCDFALGWRRGLLARLWPRMRCEWLWLVVQLVGCWHKQSTHTPPPLPSPALLCACARGVTFG